MSNAAILKKVHDVRSYILLIFQSTLRQINISVKASKYRGLMTRIFHFFLFFFEGGVGGRLFSSCNNNNYIIKNTVLYNYKIII